jgi:hypothetical protein
LTDQNRAAAMIMKRQLTGESNDDWPERLEALQATTAFAARKLEDAARTWNGQLHR